MAKITKRAVDALRADKDRDAFARDRQNRIREQSRALAKSKGDPIMMWRTKFARAAPVALISAGLLSPAFAGAVDAPDAARTHQFPWGVSSLLRELLIR